MSKQLAPTVHLNGTSREALVEEYLEAIEAVNAATAAVGRITVNARDYYVQPLGNWDIARDQHEARLQALAKVHDDLCAILQEVLG